MKNDKLMDDDEENRPSICPEDFKDGHKSHILQFLSALSGLSKPSKPQQRLNLNTFQTLMRLSNPHWL